MKHNQRKLIPAVSLCAAVVPHIASATAISGQGTWETSLQARDLDGNLATAEAYYDTDLNITWLQNANYLYASGAMPWSAAMSWVSALNPYDSGITGWRLPRVLTNFGCEHWAFSGTTCGYNVDTATSEMAHMFYTTLGNLAFYASSGAWPQPGWGLSNTGPFSHIDFPYHYWSSTQPSGYGYAWSFVFDSGYQDIYPITSSFYAWAVHDGDVGAAIPSSVPVPAAAWLFGSGLLGLIGMTRRKNA